MIRSIWTCLVFLASTVVLAVPAIVWGLVRPGSDLTFRLARVWARTILAAAGVRVSVVDEDPARDLPCIFMSNHQSAVDVWALAVCLPDRSCFVAKSSLFRVPFLGWAMAAGGFVPIDRHDRTKAMESLSVAARRLGSGKSLVMFPEGTRSRDGRLGAFKKGPFHLALATGRPVVPVAISGSWQVLPPGSALVRSGEVRVRFAAPVEVSAYAPDDVLGLMAAVRTAVAGRLGDRATRAAPDGVREGSR